MKSSAAFTNMARTVLFEKRLLLFLIGFLLGRAVILYGLSPFAVALVATAWAAQQKRLFMLNAFIVLGAFTYSVEQSAFIFLTLAIFAIQVRFLKDRTNIRFLIPFVFFSITSTRVFLYSIQGQINLYELLHLT